MTGDVMFHEFIKKTDEGIKQKLTDDENLEDMKIDEKIGRKSKKPK